MSIIERASKSTQFGQKKGIKVNENLFSKSADQLPLAKESFQAPEGWEFDGDWYIAPEMRLARTVLFKILLRFND